MVSLHFRVAAMQLDRGAVFPDQERIQKILQILVNLLPVEDDKF